MKWTFKWLFVLTLSLSFTCLPSLDAQVQTDSSDPIPAENAANTDPQPFTDSELELLVGPIALYPDPLLAILLPAATHPTEIVLATRFLTFGGDPNDIEFQPWTDSVQALAHYPEVIRWMDENLEWTTQLGEAFLRQPEEIMDAVQRLRALAQSLGNLQTTAEQLIETDDGAIDIIPATPDTIYVPTYDPYTVYARPPILSAGPYTRFNSSHMVGAWLNRDWDWPNKRIVIWTKELARPQTWWSQPRAERSKTIADLKQWRPPARAGKYPCKFWYDRSPHPAHASAHANRSQSPTQSNHPAASTAGPRTGSGHH